MIRQGVAAAAAALSLAALPAEAASPAQGLSCGLGSGTVYGGPLVFTGELATSVTYRCVVRVVTGGVARTQSFAFDTPGPAGALPPAAVTIGAADRVEVCTQAEWLFGFPGGGSVDFGCRAATYQAGPLGGYHLLPEVIA